VSDRLSIVLFSGTDDRLQAAAVLTAGAAATGRPVHVFLQYWAVNAFRRDRIALDHGASPEAGEDGRAAIAALRAAGRMDWKEVFRQAKDIGDVTIQACSLTVDLFGVGNDALDPIVDGVEGVASFMFSAGDGQIVFI
jgi:peroxiredoxin family protein